MDEKKNTTNALKKEPELKVMVSTIHQQFSEVEMTIRRLERAGCRLGIGPLNKPIGDGDGKSEGEPENIQEHLGLIQRRLSEVSGNLNLIAEHFDGLI